jgi:KaiC/GvpD/RAD55 family RecA-like ATPase
MVKIEGLDGALCERLRPRQNILLIGSSFSGKTTLGIQFLASGLKSGEHAVLVTTKDTPHGIRARAEVFGWELEKYEARGQLRYIDCYSRVIGLPAEHLPSVVRANIEEENLDKISLMISTAISDFWTEGKKIRLVFDDLTTLFYYNDLLSITRFLHTLMGRLKAVEATSIFILESGIHEEQAITVLRSLSDGVLQISGDGERRYLQGILSVGALARLPIEMSSRGLRVAKHPISRAT